MSHRNAGLNVHGRQLFISSVLRINSLIATLSMSFIISGLASKVTDGNLIVLTGHPAFGKIAQTSFLTVRTSIRIALAAFAASGTAAGLGGIIDTSRVLSAQSSSGDALAFTVLAGIVVGGTSILGGEGAVWRTVVGVLTRLLSPGPIVRRVARRRGRQSGSTPWLSSTNGPESPARWW